MWILYVQYCGLLSIHHRRLYLSPALESCHQRLSPCTLHTRSTCPLSNPFIMLLTNTHKQPNTRPQHPRARPLPHARPSSRGEGSSSSPGGVGRTQVNHLSYAASIMTVCVTPAFFHVRHSMLATHSYSHQHCSMPCDISSQHRAANGGAYPETVAINLWGLDAIKTKVGVMVGVTTPSLVRLVVML